MRRCRLWRTGCPRGSGPSTRLIVVGAAGLFLAFGSKPWARPAVAANCGAGIELVSRANNDVPANDDSEVPAVNGDGCVVAFKSNATNLASGTNTQFKVFVRDRNTGTTSRVPAAPEPNAESFPPALNACVPSLCTVDGEVDGRVVAFASAANNLLPQPTPADANNSNDVFAFDRNSGRTEGLTFADRSGNNFVGGGGADKDEPPSLSADGNLVAFTSSALHLEGTATNDSQHLQVYVHNRTSGSNTVVSVVTVGANKGKPAPADSGGAAISGDGCVVAFYSVAGTLVAGYTSVFRDVFLRDLCADPQTTELVSVPISGAATNGSSQAWPPSVSYDGRFVAFASDASNLVTGDDNHATDVFVRDRFAGVTLRVSNGTNGPSQYPSISADGRFVVFQSTDANLVDPPTNGMSQIFVVDVTDGIVRPAVRVSVSPDGDDGNGDSIAPQISGDGSTIVFQSTATNLTGDSAGGASQIFAAPNPPTPTFTNAASPTGTETPTSISSLTPSPASTPTVTPTAPPTATRTLTATIPGAPSATPTQTVTASRTATLTPTTPGVPSATPTRTAAASRSATVTPTRSPTQTGGGGGSAGGGGGGCSCGIDPGAGAGADPSAILALAFPLLLGLLRHRTRRS